MNAPRPRRSRPRPRRRLMVDVLEGRSLPSHLAAMTVGPHPSAPPPPPSHAAPADPGDDGQAHAASVHAASDREYGGAVSSAAAGQSPRKTHAEGGDTAPRPAGVGETGNAAAVGDSSGNHKEVGHGSISTFKESATGEDAASARRTEEGSHASPTTAEDSDNHLVSLESTAEMPLHVSSAHAASVETAADHTAVGPAATAAIRASAAAVAAVAAEHASEPADPSPARPRAAAMPATHDNGPDGADGRSRDDDDLTALFAALGPRFGEAAVAPAVGVVLPGGGMGRRAEAAVVPPEPGPVLRPFPAGYAVPAEEVQRGERADEEVAFAGPVAQSASLMNYLPLSGPLVGELPAGLVNFLVDPVTLDEVFAELGVVVRAGANRAGGAWLLAAALAAAAGEVARRQRRPAAAHIGRAELDEHDEPPTGWFPDDGGPAEDGMDA